MLLVLRDVVIINIMDRYIFIYFKVCANLIIYSALLYNKVTLYNK